MIPNHGPTLDFGLGETADAIRDTTARFAADRIAPIAADVDRENTFPRSLWPLMGDLGLHGITVEEDFGGLGILALGVLGVGLLALAAIWGFQSESEQVLGVSPHTAGLTIGLIGIVCFGIAAYVMLDRLGTPRDRHFD